MLQKPKAWFNSWETNLTIFKQRATRLLLKLHVRFEKKSVSTTNHSGKKISTVVIFLAKATLVLTFL